MRIIAYLVIATIGGFLSPLAADFPAPFQAQRAEIDRAVAELVTTRDPDLLEKFKSEFIANQARPLSVRAYAISRLGEERLESTEQYFDQVAEHGDDPAVRNAARIAYWTGRVQKIESQAERRTTLVHLLHGETKPVSSSVRLWAAQELCEEGLPELVPTVEKAMAEFVGESRKSEEMLLCGLQVDVISKATSREAALMAALDMPDPTALGRFHLWAIGELSALGTESACTALINHALSLQEGDVGVVWTELSVTLRALRRAGVSKDELLRRGLTPRLVAGAE